MDMPVSCNKAGKSADLPLALLIICRQRVEMLPMIV